MALDFVFLLVSCNFKVRFCFGGDCLIEYRAAAALLAERLSNKRQVSNLLD